MKDRAPFFYFDNNATTRVAPEVLQAMLPFLTELWGNPSSAYSFGHELSEHLDNARRNVAALINADPREIVFTGCGTESINTAIQSALAIRPDKRHVLTTAVEHSATIKYCQHLQKKGYDITFLPVNADGALDLKMLESAMRSDTAIVSVMWANNETGILFPVRQIAEMCRAKSVLFHTDAVQAVGKISVDVRDVDADFLSLSGHKINAPKGVGALYVKRHTRFQPFLIGGGQERGRRGGTENVASIAGFGRAAELAKEHLAPAPAAALRDRLENGILSQVPGSVRNGGREPRLPNTSNIAFEGVEAEGILLMLDQVGICVSSGSACTTGSLDPSHVLLAMGCSAARARGSIRFSLGPETTEAEVDYVLEHLPAVIQKLRDLAPV